MSATFFIPRPPEAGTPRNSRNSKIDFKGSIFNYLAPVGIIIPTEGESCSTGLKMAFTGILRGGATLGGATPSFFILLDAHKQQTEFVLYALRGSILNHQLQLRIHMHLQAGTW